MMFKLTILAAGALAPAVLLGPDAELEWEQYYTYEGMEYYWAPDQTGTTQRDGRTIPTAHARSIPEPEERGGRYESASFEWRFAIDCEANEIAILEYASGHLVEGTVVIAVERQMAFEEPNYKEIGLPPGGHYETLIAELVCPQP